MVDNVLRVDRNCIEFGMMYGVLRPFSVTFTLSFTLHDHMMTHLHPPTSSSPLDLVREGFSLFVFGSSSALIENDRTEIWMTVGFVDTVEVGRLFDERVVSSCKIRPAWRILKYDGEGGWLGSVQSEGHIDQINSFIRPTVNSGSKLNTWFCPLITSARTCTMGPAAGGFVLLGETGEAADTCGSTLESRASGWDGVIGASEGAVVEVIVVMCDMWMEEIDWSIKWPCCSPLSM